MESPSDLCLLYSKTNQVFTSVNGTTHIGQIIESFQDQGRTWYVVKLLTDDDGSTIYADRRINVLKSAIITDRPVQDIQPHHFFQLNSSPDPTATHFVIKSNLNQPLASTSRSGFGSGIFGIYVSNDADIKLYRTDPEQNIYQIELHHPYIIQDSEHGDSITAASLHTNNYLDRILEEARQSNFNVSVLIRDNCIDRLVNLWNIVFIRTFGFGSSNEITRSRLRDILVRYVERYLTQDNLYDTSQQSSIQELPINHIMMELGYDGLLAKDVYNNRWTRGCVRYVQNADTILQGSTASY